MEKGCLAVVATVVCEVVVDYDENGKPVHAGKMN